MWFGKRKDKGVRRDEGHLFLGWTHGHPRHGAAAVQQLLKGKVTYGI